jgi:hypothetical protein
MAFAVTESQAAGAVAIPGRAAMLAVSQESRMLIAAESLVTFSVKDVEAEPGIDTPIAITLPSDADLRGAGAEEGTFLLIRNIPEGVSVSAGMATGRICIVPLREASALRLISKPGANARFQLEFHLIGTDSRLLAETIISVNLRPPEVVGALDPASPEPAAPDFRGYGEVWQRGRRSRAGPQLRPGLCPQIGGIGPRARPGRGTEMV